MSSALSIEIFWDMGRHFRSIENTRNEKQHLLKWDWIYQFPTIHSKDNKPISGNLLQIFFFFFDSFYFKSHLEAQIFIIWFPRKKQKQKQKHILLLEGYLVPLKFAEFNLVQCAHLIDANHKSKLSVIRNIPLLNSKQANS